jgi:hypothetical protein
MNFIYNTVTNVTMGFVYAMNKQKANEVCTIPKDAFSKLCVVHWSIQFYFCLQKLPFPAYDFLSDCVWIFVCLYRNKSCRLCWDDSFNKIIHNPIPDRRQVKHAHEHTTSDDWLLFESRSCSNLAISEFPLHLFQTFLLTLVRWKPLHNTKLQTMLSNMKYRYRACCYDCVAINISRERVQSLWKWQ